MPVDITLYKTGWNTKLYLEDYVIQVNRARFFFQYWRSAGWVVNNFAINYNLKADSTSQST